MDHNAMVSIIVPVYGTEAYLPACIDSLCNQSYSNIQIILVDDQSPDRCPEICDSYAERDSRIVVIHQNNKGVSGARNTGMAAATGDYLMFVDSDDILYQEAIEILINDMYEYDADIVSAVKSITNSEGEIISTVNNDSAVTLFQGKEPLILSLKGDLDTYSACAKLFKSSFIKDICFQEGKDVNEDGFFVFECYLKAPKLVQHNIPVYQYNQRVGSNSRQVFSEKYFSMLYFCERKKELLAGHPQFDSQLKNMEVRVNLQLLDLLCRPTDKNYKDLERKCIHTVCSLYKYHQPINNHHKKLSRIVVWGIYPLYKLAVRFKYYR